MLGFGFELRFGFGLRFGVGLGKEIENTSNIHNRNVRRAATKNIQKTFKNL